VILFVSDLLYISDFLRVLPFPHQDITEILLKVVLNIENKNKQTLAAMLNIHNMEQKSFTSLRIIQVTFLSSLIPNSPVVGEKYIEDPPSNLSIKFNSK
jgi:hypothetical protein